MNNTEELKRRLAKQYMVSELDTRDAYAVEWTVAAIKSNGFDFQRFREINTQRAEEGFKTYTNVPKLFWTTAIAGEVGELCNMIKKLERVKYGGIDAGTNHKAADITQDVLAEEIGGIFIYLDLLASLYGIDLEEAILKTFNDKSEKYNLIKYEPAAPQPDKSNEAIEGLKELRNYFGEHDKTPQEHRMFSIADKLYKLFPPNEVERLNIKEKFNDIANGRDERK